MKPNLLIRASAGTGKTFSLATRFLRLMLFEGVSPERIIALTFSRAAASEIYQKLLERLWKASADERGAAEEKDVLLKGLSQEDLDAVGRKITAWTPALFGETLRRVVDVQHVNAIATLDSFILKIVRSFPLEMGFQHAVSVLDGAGVRRAVEATTRTMLADRDPRNGAAFEEAFAQASRGEFERKCLSKLQSLLNAWREFLAAHSETDAWTASSMCAALGLPADPAPPDLAALEVGNKNDVREKFVKHVREFQDADKVFPDTKTGEFMDWAVAEPEASEWVYATKSGKEVRVPLSREQRTALDAGIRHLVARGLKAQFACLVAQWRLCRLVERDYDATTRRRGQLTFADFTRCQALNEDSERGLQIQNLQYRFDERFDHWALDEFQDTSALQWRCLKRLVLEAAGDPARSVMAVGDLKQSIYMWRGGDDGPFKELMSSECFQDPRGEILPNRISFRYEKHTADFINEVFGAENMADESLWHGACRAGRDYWLSEACWMNHEPNTDRNGRKKDGDFVRVVAVAPAPADPDAAEGEEAPAEDAMENVSPGLKTLAPGIVACVKELWTAHEAAQSTDSVGVLVRKNVDGAYLAECLRAAEVPVVWEGFDGLLAAPAVRATLSLLRLAEHPEDTLAWRTVDEVLPVRRLAYPDRAGAKSVSAAVSEELSQLGLARTLRRIATCLSAPEAELDARSKLRLEALVRAAVSFEDRRDGATSLDDFEQYLRALSGRETTTSSQVVRILSFHRSKGLTIDHVIVPVCAEPRRGSLVRPDRCVFVGKGWALASLKPRLAAAVPALKAAYDDAANAHLLERLRLYYVALTRARKSTYVFCLDGPHADATGFGDVIRHAFPAPSGEARPTCGYGTVWYEAGRPFSFGRKTAPKGVSEPWTHAAAAERIVRRTPSAPTFAAGRGAYAPKAGDFLAPDADAARVKGLEIHRQLAACAWIDPAAAEGVAAKILADDAWRAAFVKTPRTVGLWREKPYERVVAGASPAERVWESGRIDRVVFSEVNGIRSAIVYDYKTNAPREGESDEAFRARLALRYADQMAAYRAAVASLAGLPPERVSSVILPTVVLDL